MKTCNGCKVIILEDQMVFTKTPKGTRYQKPWCKTCDQKRYYKYAGSEDGKTCICGKKGRFGFNINYCSTECRIKLKIDSINEKKCWNTKYAEKLIYINWKPKKAKRLRVFTYEYYNNKELPQGMALITTCKNTLCINPDHLSLVTRTEVSKIGAQIATHNQRNKKDPIKKEILKLFLEEKMTIKQLAEKYNKSMDSMESYIAHIRKRFKNKYCLVCKKESEILYNAKKKYYIVCSEVCKNIYILGSKTIEDIIEKYYIHKWPAKHIVDLYKICPKRTRKILKKYHEYQNNSIKFELEEKGICSNCQQKHDNTESEFCSPSCMQEFLLK